jgi:cellulose biosynthesis protein BcsQ
MSSPMSPSGDVALRNLLMPHAALVVVPVVPTAVGLASLTQVEPGTPLIELEHTAFIINRLDETRRFARNAHSFLRELLGGKIIGAVHEDEGQRSHRHGPDAARPLAASVALSDMRDLATTVAAVCGQPSTEEEAA